MSMNPPERPNPQNVTLLLREVGAGRQGAVDELFSLVYDELRRIAGSHFEHQPANHTLQPTALIHEAYLRMVDAAALEVNDRSHFFALASKVMRRLLVDHCRRRTASKRGGSWVQVSMDGVGREDDQQTLDVLDLDEALQRLAAHDERKSRIVELRFFGGLAAKEVATILNLSLRTVEADWSFARAWLKKEISGRRNAAE